MNPLRQKQLKPRNIKKLCGIYAIELPELKKVYIGQSINIHNRWSQHKTVLKKKRCENEDFQNHWNKYSQDFEFKIVEQCNKADLNDKEQEIANQYIADGWTLLNSYFMVNPVNMLIRPEHKPVFTQIARLLDKGRLTLDALERSIENL